MRLIRCCRCDEAKPEEQYAPSARLRRPNGTGMWCRSCRCDYQNGRLRSEPALAAKKRAYDRAYKKATQQRVEAIKVLRGCELCGEKHPGVLDFHHRDPKGKTMTVSRAVYGRGWAAVEAEMAKCELLCANCHRKKHYDEKTGAWWPADQAMRHWAMRSSPRAALIRNYTGSSSLARIGPAR